MPRTSSLIEQPETDPVMTAPVAVAAAILAARFLADLVPMYSDSPLPEWGAILRGIEREAAELPDDVAKSFTVAALALCAPLRGAR